MPTLFIYNKHTPKSASMPIKFPFAASNCINIFLKILLHVHFSPKPIKAKHHPLREHVCSKAKMLYDQ